MKSESGFAALVLWSISAIEFDNKVISNVLWHFQHVIAKVRSRSGQKGQILNLININQKGVYQMQIELMNPMVSFVLLYDVENWQKIALCYCSYL